MSPEEWVHLFIFISAGSVLAGAISWAITSPYEVARLKSIIRSRWGRRSWRKLDRMGLDVLVAIEADVEMAWWEEQYEKLLGKQSTSFAQLSAPSMAELRQGVSNSLRDSFAEYEREYRSVRLENQARELAEWSRSIASVKVGSATLSEGESVVPRRKAEPDCDECDYVELHTYSGAYQHVRSERCQQCRAREHQDAARKNGFLTESEAREFIARTSLTLMHHVVQNGSTQGESPQTTERADHGYARHSQEVHQG